MKRVTFLLFALVLSSVTPAVGSLLRGSVTLFPIDSATFHSVGEATFYNDLNQQDVATLSGEHVVAKVSPTSANFVAAVTGNGSYYYGFDGPTDPGACYATSLHVIADAAQPDLLGRTHFEEQ